MIMSDYWEQNRPLKKRHEDKKLRVVKAWIEITMKKGEITMKKGIVNIYLKPNLISNCILIKV